MKYLANFKKVVLLAIKNGWVQKDPFIGFKLTKKEVNRPCLNEHELQKIASKEFKTERLTLVRDIFIFSCYTGLAYADVKKLKRKKLLKVWTASNGYLLNARKHIHLQEYPYCQLR